MYDKIKLSNTRKGNTMWVKISRNNNYSINENGEVRNDNTGKIKKPTLNKANGYFYVDLYENNKCTKAPIHRLVAEAFIENPDEKPTVDHIDGNRQNNSISNLRWATYGEQNSRFKTIGVRSQRVKATHYAEVRKKRGGGHLAWGKVDKILYFDRIGDCADYFNSTISNISLRLESKAIGVRGKTRAWLIEYDEGSRATFKKS